MPLVSTRRGHPNWGLEYIHQLTTVTPSLHWRASQLQGQGVRIFMQCWFGAVKGYFRIFASVPTYNFLACLCLDFMSGCILLMKWVEKCFPSVLGGAWARLTLPVWYKLPVKPV